MALGATIHRFSIELSDVERSVYESLDLRVAQHPSETPRRMIARVLAYALQHEEGIDFGRGLSATDDPAVWVRDPAGDVRVWIEVGQPSPERLHRASKAAGRTVVYAYADPTPWLRELDKATVHRREALELWVLPPSLLDALEAALERHERWSLTVSEGTLYLTRGEATFEGTLERLP
ncbi:MAG: YaeQ family protein [Sandaracinus sp.]|nr:YaeQ family protein [Sandaracinus sp.]MCB9617986.1 YaeQ family protein [Sandaracinus sp.]MCB9635199.1 YaeQ family protein [Sandaracinus sp.]